MRGRFETIAHLLFVTFVIMPQTPKNIAVIGSGLVGALLAIYLRKAGHQVTVFDRRPDIRKINFSGRSINLAMSTRGWKTLQGVGLEEKVKQIAIPLYARALHVNDKPLYFQKYGKESQAIWSISRGILNRKMIDFAESYIWVPGPIGARFEQDDGRMVSAIPGAGVLSAFDVKLTNANWLHQPAYRQPAWNTQPGVPHAGRGAVTPFYQATIEATADIAAGSEM